MNPELGTVEELITPDNGANWMETVTAAQQGPAFEIIGKSRPKLSALLTNANAVRAIAGRIPALLRLDLGVILIGGWKKIEELRTYTNAQKYGPEETIMVELTRHVINSTHDPNLEITVNHVKVDTMPFELKVSLTIDGAVLTIRGGKIHAVSPGTCKASLELKCEKYTLLKREPAPIRLPGTWTFKEPVAIPPPKPPEKH